ncbi:MAG TPA: DUF4411 family protein [Anaerolineaceae bacterium]|nr:DUF4411 family protein [Anaerolineaceae bacterium]
MEYCLDTSVYIQAHRAYYAFDLTPGFWIGLQQNAEKKVILSPGFVYSELASGNDELAKWVKERRKVLFVDPDKNVVEVYRQIVEFCNSRYDDDHWIREFLNGADPWVVAQAKAQNLTVVTMERKKGSEDINPKSGRFRGELKIPNICDHFGVKYISTYDLVRILKISLG